MRYFIILLLAMMSLEYQAQTFGNAILLNGQNDYITVPDNANLNQATTITVELWINPCNVDSLHNILSKNWCAGNQNAYSLGIRDGALEWGWGTGACGSGSHIFRSTAPIIVTNTWQHVAISHTASGVTMYLNGVPVNASLVLGGYSNITPSNEPLRIGAYRFSAGNIGSFFDGMIDEVRIWNYNLSSSTILSQYNVALQGNETGLVAYYDLDNISGSGSSITVPNNASFLGSIIDGTTVGTSTSPSFVSFKSNSLCSGELTGIEDEGFSFSYSVYPNPTTKAISIDFGETIADLEISLSNNLGQTVFTKKYSATGFVTIDIETPKGIYFLQLKTASGSVETIKVLKQ